MWIFTNVQAKQTVWSLPAFLTQQTKLVQILRNPTIASHKRSLVFAFFYNILAHSLCVTCQVAQMGLL